MGEGGGVRGWVRWWGKGWGEVLTEVFEQNRYHYFRLGCQNPRSDTKSEQNCGESPILGESPL